MAEKQTISVDFDGVLHSYMSGWHGAANIPDPPTPGAQEFMRALPELGFKPVVQSARAASDQGLDAIAGWMHKWGFPGATISHGKPFAAVYLDDRALRFTGTWPTLEEMLTASVPWNR